MKIPMFFSPNGVATKYSPPPPTTVQPVMAKRRQPTGSPARDFLQRLSYLMSSVLHVSVAQLLENFLSVVSLVFRPGMRKRKLEAVLFLWKREDSTASAST